MKWILKYNGNAKHSTKDLKGEYTRDDILALVVYLCKKGQFV